MVIFSKFHGAGNDFILVEDFEKTFPHTCIKQLCDRRLGIGADGLILAQSSALADYKMVYFNADGSHAGMCGNGLRCFVHFLKNQGIVKPLYRIEVDGKILTVKCQGSKIITLLPLPKVLHWGIELLSYTAYVVDIGVPHVVVFANGKVDVLQEGGAMRHHEKLKPSGANVNFVWKTSENIICIDTYERGVENITLACGTGGASSAFVAHRLGLCGDEIKVVTRSKEELQIRIGKEIEIIGPSVKVFDAYFF